MVIRPAAPGLFRVVCSPEGGDKGEGEGEEVQQETTGEFEGKRRQAEGKESRESVAVFIK